LAKAEQFWLVAQDSLDLADEAEDVGDACATLLVHAGIAAADVICCARLGVHALGENHKEAIALLKSADQESERHLVALLKMKTRAGYAHTSISRGDLKKATRAAEALLTTARGM